MHIYELCPNGHHDEPPPPLCDGDDDDEPSVENVVSVAYGSDDDETGGGTDDADGDGGADAEEGGPNPGDPPPIDGNSPPAVGGAVGSIRCAASMSSGDGGAIIFVIMMPMPSINASSTPPTSAALAMARGPARPAKIPPVAAPLTIEFHGSSFWRMAVSEQSQHAKSPPHTANCPPSTGARACTALSEPVSRAPAGASRAPLMECQMPPPMFPMQKAPPTSSTMRHGHGSLSASPDCRGIFACVALLSFVRSIGSPSSV
mmetsp:Transcript_18462/g.52760  ORF Transcript_18462/g.52760 Transcript_18462/m.52760 type:complete len:260 (-) Transcript_18462:66-845(-)